MFVVSLVFVIPPTLVHMLSYNYSSLNGLHVNYNLKILIIQDFVVIKKEFFWMISWAIQVIFQMAEIQVLSQF